MREQLQAMNQLFARQLEVIRGSPGRTGAPVLLQRASDSRDPATGRPCRLHPPAHAVRRNRKDFKPFGPYKPPSKGGSGEMTERQRKALDDLIALYAKRTAKSKRRRRNSASRWPTRASCLVSAKNGRRWCIRS